MRVWLIAARLGVSAGLAGSLLVGCGGSVHTVTQSGAAPAHTTSSGPKTPDAAAISQIRGAFADIALACLSPNVDETKLDNDVNTLVETFKKYSTASFSIGGPTLTLRSILERSRDQLRNCEASGRAPNAGSLADAIDHQLQK